MRYLIIAALLAALVLEVRLIYWMNDEVPMATATTPATGPVVYPETGEVEIGAQLSARALRIQAEHGEPVWPVNPAQGHRIVRGFVYRDGAPVRRAPVTIDERPLSEGVKLDGFIGHPRWTDTTTDKGYFEFDTLAAGTFILRAWDKDGMAVCQVDLPRDVQAQEVSLTLSPAQAMNGVVVAENPETGIEEPVNDALVFPLVAAEGAGRDAVLLAYLPTRTGENGAFGFSHLRGAVRFAVNAAGHDPWVSPLVPSGSGNLHFKLAPGGVVKGVVREEGGDMPLPGVRITLRAKGMPLAPFQGRSGQDGGFTLSGVPAGDYVLDVEQGDYVLHESPPEIAVWPGKTFEAPPLPVIKAGVVEGRVADEAGHALAEVVVVAQLGARRFETVSDAGGRYSIRHLLPGDYAIGAVFTDGRVAAPESVPVTIASGAVTDGPVFTVPEGEGAGAVTLLVVDARGTPVHEAAIHYSLLPPDVDPSPRVDGVLLSDAAGRATLRNVPVAWRYGVYASIPGMASAPLGWERLPESGNVEHKLAVDQSATCRLAGRVTRGVTPVVGKGVTAHRAGGMGWPFSRWQATSAGGAFDFMDLAPGNYELCADGAPSSCIEVAATPDAPVSGLLLSLD